MTTTDAAISRSEIIDAAGNIEPLPASLSRLLQLLADENFDVGEIVETLGHDPTLAGDVLGRANSIASGARSHIADLRQAIARIGAREIVSIAMRRAMQSRFAVELPPYGLDANHLWEHSITASVAAEHVRKQAGTPVAPMLATTALIHDVGKLVIGRCLPGNSVGLLSDAALREGLAIHEAERKVLGIDHAEISGVVARSWGLPVSVQVALTQHHEPERADVFTSALALADHIAHSASDYRAAADAGQIPDDDPIGAARPFRPAVDRELGVCVMTGDLVDRIVVDVARETSEILAEYH